MLEVGILLIDEVRTLSITEFKNFHFLFIASSPIFMEYSKSNRLEGWLRNFLSDGL